MRRTGFFKLGIIVVAILIIFSACSVLPPAISGLFITETPTPSMTPTPTNTPTPTQTLTPKPTPVSPLGLDPCAFSFYCSEVLSVNDLISDDLQSGETYRVDVPYNMPLHFGVWWIAASEEDLSKNIANMNFFFEIDGQSYFRDEVIELDFVMEDEDTGRANPSVGMGYVLDGWNLDEPHVIRIGFDFPRGVNDGWNIYPPGTSYDFTYVINPVPPPTPTPKPTNTPTATNTPKPQPTAVPFTPTPACSLTGTLRIINNTGGTVTLYLTGPAKFTFYVPTGTTTYNICPGSYSYTAYGCGGASINGTAKDGEEIEFWCE